MSGFRIWPNVKVYPCYSLHQYCIPFHFYGYYNYVLWIYHILLICLLLPLCFCLVLVLNIEPILGRQALLLSHTSSLCLSFYQLSLQLDYLSSAVMNIHRQIFV